MLRKQLKESLWGDFIDLFRGNKDAPLDRSNNVFVRSKDMRHESPSVTVMIKKHKEHRTGKESYDWTLKEPVNDF